MNEASNQLPIDYNALLSRAASGDIPQFTRQEQAVMSLISRGRENAIPVDTIAELTGIHWREVQQVVKHLIEDHSILILSSCGKMHGYYLPESEEDFRIGMKNIINRLISLAKRLKAMDREKYESIFGQGNLLENHGGHHG